MKASDLERLDIFTINIIGEDTSDRENNFFTFPKSSGFMFSPPSIYKQEFFFKDENVPNKMASRVISKLLVEALAGNIHMAHQKEEFDSAEHLREVIEYLETLFISQTEIGIHTIIEKIKK